MNTYKATPIPSRLGGKTYQLSEDQGFLNLMNGYCAQWFRESAHLEQYEQSIQEFEALL